MFRPTRTSRPVKPTQIVRGSGSGAPSVDLSIVSTSTVVVPELRHLTADELDFFDAVIKHAGPKATTFPLVFKSYNTVLKERGMDSEETRFYWKLLKLGTVKGKTWAEKWDFVKRQHTSMVSDDDEESVSSRVRPRVKSITPSISVPIPRLQDLDADITGTDSDTDTPQSHIPQYHETMNISSQRNTTSISNSPLVTRTRNSPLSSISTSQHKATSTRRKIPASEISLSDDTDVPRPTGTPSPYVRFANRASGLSGKGRALPQPRITNHSTPRPEKDRTPAASRALSQARENRRRQEEDAWNEVRIRQLEEEADRYRNERLLKKCWEVWQQGYEWIMIATDRVDQARNTVLIGWALHRWNKHYVSYQKRLDEVTSLAANRRLQKAYLAWKKKFTEQQRLKWQNDMREKINQIKDRQNAHILRKCLGKWAREYKSRLAIQHHNYLVRKHGYGQWKVRFARIDGLEAKADEFLSSKDPHLLLKYWNQWNGVARIASVERIVVERRQARILWEALETWQKRIFDKWRTAAIYDRNLKGRSLKKWKQALQRIHALNDRADKHMARQDKILTCAVFRVWVAHIQGREAQRHRDQKILAKALSTWQDRMLLVKKKEELALVFYQDTTTGHALSRIYTQWRQLYESHRRNHDVADQHRQLQVFKRWRSRYRELVEDRKHQRLIKKLQDRQAARILSRWLVRTRQKRHCAQVEALVQERLQKRLGRNALSHWTQRVIFMRERELFAIESHRDKLTRFAWQRLKSAYSRHQENLKLLEDHIVLKREDILKRYWQRWRATKHFVQHRRFVLETNEAQILNATMQKAWDKWRDRYLELQLRPLEYEMLLRTQQNLLYRAFSVWHAKAKNKPAIMAIKIYATRCKKRFYEQWKAAMPIAQQNRKAREMYSHAVLRKVFNHWLQVYRTKLALKAIARARYLRLPTTGIRAGGTPSGVPSLSLSPPHESTPISLVANLKRREESPFSRRALPAAQLQTSRMRAADEDDEELEASSSTGERTRLSRLSRSPFGLEHGTGIVSLLRTNIDQKGKSDLSPPRSKYHFANLRTRNPSPERSVTRDRGGFFSSAIAESTPPVRTPGPKTFDEVGARRPLWGGLKANRRSRASSPATTSRTTYSLPSP